MTAEEVRAKLAEGLPLLYALELDLDYDAACDLMVQLARAIEQLPSGDKRNRRPLPWTRGKAPDTAMLYEYARSGDGAALRAAAARQIRLALEQGKLDTRELLPRVAAGEKAYADALIQSLQLDASLVWTLAWNTLRPAWQAWHRQLAPLMQGVEWRRGYCPVCGMAATLGELQDNGQVKHLRCSQCGADWLFPRMQCIYCGNEDHTTQSYFYPDGEREQHRIEVCDECGGYLKVSAAFSPTPVELLPVEDLATVHLDYIAQERGYARVQVR
jgi:formate dehydrogenase accessory protein FdhE